MIDGDRENGVGIDVAGCCSERMKFAMGEVCYVQVPNTYCLQPGKFSYVLQRLIGWLHGSKQSE